MDAAKPAKLFEPSSSLSSLRAWYFLFFAAMSTDLYLPLLFADVMRFSTSQIGMLQAGRRVLRLVGAPLFTYICDATRKHRIIVVLGLVTCYVATVALGAVRTLLAVVVVLFVRDGANSFIPATVDAAATATLATPGNSGASYGRLRLFGSLGWGSACFFNGVIVDNIFAGDLRVPLFIQVILGVVVCTLASHFIDLSPQLFEFEEQRRKAARPQPAGGVGSESLDAAWAWRVATFVANVIMAGVALGTESTSLYLYASESLHIPTSILGLSTFISCTCEALCFMCLGAIVRRLGGPQRTFKVGVVLSATCLLVLANVHRAANPVAPFLAVQVLIGTVFAFYWGTAVQISAELAPVGRETSAQGMLNAVGWGLGAPLGDLAGGLGLQSMGGPRLYTLVAVVELAVLVLPLAAWALLAAIRRRRQGYSVV